MVDRGPGSPRSQAQISRRSDYTGTNCTGNWKFYLSARQIITKEFEGRGTSQQKRDYNDNADKVVSSTADEVDDEDHHNATRNGNHDANKDNYKGSEDKEENEQHSNESSIHEDTNENNDANDNNSTRTDDSSGNDGNANDDIKVVIGDENNSTITSSATTEKVNIKVPSVILVGTQKGVSYQGLMYSLT